ncbi:molecular chaperone TorD family protein [Pistricoccus aurantiacus]|uniref:Molecular chaperone TorD family protein n=1 Tax=Pistricoccus aurantiacus TaxID=1883414 RepID=A0A5B8SYY2_9GAMM|nr:molecular chaperone TorD family protein [Pistricoccus aurantiacus]QEA40008.1 molecular chaperone TorD family protein [Pistricoccus aurantiacus]
MTSLNDFTPTFDDERALRADIYRLLGALLLAAPDVDLLDWLGGLEIEEDDSPLALHWQALARAAANSNPDALTQAHFGHLVGVIQGDVVPYASWYWNGRLMDEPLIVLRRDLRRLGIARAAHSNDPEDHLAALCEVMALLIESASETVNKSEATFFLRHIAPWAERCMADLARVETPFYACLGELGQHFFALERERLVLMDKQDTSSDLIASVSLDTPAGASD